MELLFRSPLLEFDVKNPDEVKAHWPSLLARIKLSSQDLFNQIRDKRPENLSARENMAVYKYLLRGRFRATPFGRWAGVGVAKWSTEPKRDLNTLTTCPIELPTATEGAEHWMNPSLLPWGDEWKFWNYDAENGRWRYSKSEDSPVVQRIRTLGYEGKPIDQRSLFAGFPGLDQDEKRYIWEHLLANQLLVSSPFGTPPPDHCHEDHFILQRPEVSIHHKQQLDGLFSEIGKLAIPTPSPYLVHLRELFIDEYDDRFVPLTMFWPLVSQIDPHSKKEEQPNTYQKGSFPSILEKQTTLDLRQLNLDFGNSNKAGHVQGLFRVLDDGQILLDNLVYNRPFVYAGRFTHCPEVFEYFKGQGGDVEGRILADVWLFEGAKASRVSSHRNISKFSINCFGGSTSPDELDSADLFIGLEDGRFKLVPPRFGKEVIPVFQHPLNPHFITHPICRILWEVGHQDLLKPVHYCHDSFLNSDYVPQLNWGDIILQPRQWSLRWEGKNTGETEMMELLSSRGIPKNILVGQLDEELALDLECKMDRNVLYEEIRKNKSLRIHEWLWQSPGGQSSVMAANLQYVWGMDLPQARKGLDEIQHLNYLARHQSKDWLSVRIILVPDFQQTMVMKQLILLVEELGRAGIHTFYYLYYRIKNPEIRLRIKLGEFREKALVPALIYSSFEKIPDLDHIKSQPYYPEYAKYSEEGMGISEELFYQESKLLLSLHPKTRLEKLSLAVGLGGLLTDSDGRLDYWINYFNERSADSNKHDSIKTYELEFLSQTTGEWRLCYASNVGGHPWIGNPQRSGKLIANHLHMLINRIFWEDGLEMEREVFALLGKAVRKKKFG